MGGGNESRMSTSKALIVEDTREIARILETLLSAEGYEVTVDSDGTLAADWVALNKPELIVLDLTLPKVDGMELCRQLRSMTDAYVIMVTGRSGEMDKVLGLSVGADDYLTKPFSPRELTARMRAMRRRPRRTKDGESIRSFTGIKIDVGSREVDVDGSPIVHTKIEFDILDTLTSSPRRTGSRERLMDVVWGEPQDNPHILDVHVGNLRRKLGESGSDSHFVTTVRGVGYRFEPSAEVS